MKSDAFKGFVKALIFIFAILIVLFVIKYFRWEDKDLNEFDIRYVEKGDEDEVKPGKETVTDPKYKELYSKVNFENVEFNFGKEFFDMYYGNKEFTDEYYIFMGIINILNDEVKTNCNIDKSIDSVEVEMSIRNIFGNINYNNKSFELDNSSFVVTYDQLNSVYKVVTNKCSGFDYSNGGIKTEYYKAELINDNLYIYEKVAYLNYSTDSNGALIFNYHNGLTSNDPIIGNNFDDELMKRLPTYKLVFEKENNNYKFVSIVKDY